MSTAKRSVISAVATMDIASLAFSASALAAIEAHDGDSGRTVSSALVIVAGICLLCFVRLLPDLAAAGVLFVVGVLMASITTVATGSSPWLELIGLVLALLGPWPVGMVIFVIGLASINVAYGDSTGNGLPMTGEAWLVIILAAVVVAFGFLIDAAKQAGMAAAVAAATLGMFLLLSISAVVIG